LRDLAFYFVNGTPTPASPRLFDVTSGANGTCTIAYLCTALTDTTIRGWIPCG